MMKQATQTIKCRWTRTSKTLHPYKQLVIRKSIAVPRTSCEWYKELLSLNHNMAECNKEKAIYLASDPVHHSTVWWLISFCRYMGSLPLGGWFQQPFSFLQWQKKTSGTNEPNSTSQTLCSCCRPYSFSCFGKQMVVSGYYLGHVIS